MCASGFNASLIRIPFAWISQNMTILRAKEVSLLRWRRRDLLPVGPEVVLCCFLFYFDARDCFRVPFAKLLEFGDDVSSPEKGLVAH